MSFALLAYPFEVVGSDTERMHESVTNPGNNPHTPTESNVTGESRRAALGSSKSKAKGTNSF